MTIAVLDSNPARSQGVLTALEAAGFSAEATDDLAKVFGEGHAAVVCLDSPKVVNDIRHVCTCWPDATIVALLPVPSPSACLMALQAGAVAVAPQDASLQHIVTAVLGALEGYAVVPRAVARYLVHETASCAGSPSFSLTELELLHRLATGTTVTTLARELGYSERSLYRLLGSMYRRLGASNRSGALIAAARYGLIELRDDRSPQ